MMKNILIVLISLSILASCTGNTIYEKPEDLIPKDSMILLLKDLYLASSAKGIKNKDLRRQVSYIPLVYQAYKIDSLRFNLSNFYYTSKIDVYEPMFDKVLGLLKEELTLFEQIKKVKDSIRQDSLKKEKAARRKNKNIDKIDLSKKRKLPIEFLKKTRGLKKKSI